MEKSDEDNLKSLIVLHSASPKEPTLYVVLYLIANPSAAFRPILFYDFVGNH